MKVQLVRIGNSRGIRIPEILIDQCGFGDAVELHIEDNRLVIAAERAPRHGWKAAFAAAGTAAVDALPFEPLPPNEFDDREWTW